MRSISARRCAASINCHYETFRIPPLMSNDSKKTILVPGEGGWRRRRGDDGTAGGIATDRRKCVAVEQKFGSRYSWTDLAKCRLYEYVYRRQIHCKVFTLQNEYRNNGNSLQDVYESSHRRKQYRYTVGLYETSQ